LTDLPTDGGGGYSTEALTPRLYDELKRLAVHKAGRNTSERVLSGTSLLHEAYIRLRKEGDGAKWGNENQFFSAAAEAMRRVLVDKIRAKQRLKRGGDFQRTSMDESAIEQKEPDSRLLEVNEALSELEKLDPDIAVLVKLRYFVGMTLEEISDSMGVSVSTLTRRWAYARSWLARALAED